MSWQELYQRLLEKKDGKYQNLIKYIDNMQKIVKEQDEVIKKKEENLKQINHEAAKYINKQQIIIKEKDEIIKQKDKIIKQKEDDLNHFKKSKDQSQVYEDQKSEEFYDVIVKINSIKNLTKGWEILMNEKGEENYKNFLEKEILRISVIGNENKGKTTILKKISDFDLPSGYSIKTEGLSIKYPQLEKSPNLKIVLLDSAGFETPVLNGNKIYKNNKNNRNIISSVNSIYKEESDLEFLEMARDKSLTEIFLQNYIIKNSDLLLLVFGKLSFEEQKLLLKIKRDMKNLGRKNPLIVIHNLKEFERRSQVEKYIKETLLNSSTFNLCLDKEINKDKTETEWVYFYESSSDPKIFHLIFAREGTEAGYFYNQKSIDYILSETKHITDKQPFDIINSIRDTFCSVSESILEEPLKNEEIAIENKNYIK